nr:hypothetical protein [Candidatus Sigynarchaeota archaeon]
MKKNTNRSTRIILIEIFFFFTVIALEMMQQGSLRNNIMGEHNDSKGIQCSGTPTSNYVMTPGFSYAWLDASVGSRCDMAGSDDNYQNVVLPFSFSFYNTTYNSIYICTNGFASFTPSNTCSYTTVPSSSSSYCWMIAPFLVDLRAANPCNIYYMSVPATNSFVIEWKDIYTLGGILVGSFEIVLYASGDIVFSYEYIRSCPTHTCGLNYGINTSFYNQYFGLTAGMQNFSIHFGYQPPTLTDPVVSGNGSGTFEFSVLYADPDNDAPGGIIVIINGSWFSMTKIDPSDANYMDGCRYGFNYTLSAGTYVYYFRCNDGNYVTTSAEFDIEVESRPIIGGNDLATFLFFIVSFAVIGTVMLTSAIAFTRRIWIKKMKLTTAISGQNAIISPIDYEYWQTSPGPSTTQAPGTPGPQVPATGEAGEDSTVIIRSMITSIQKVRRLMQYDISDYSDQPACMEQDIIPDLSMFDAGIEDDIIPDLSMFDVEMERIAPAAIAPCTIEAGAVLRVERSTWDNDCVSPVLDGTSNGFTIGPKHVHCCPDCGIKVRKEENLEVSKGLCVLCKKPLHVLVTCPICFNEWAISEEDHAHFKAIEAECPTCFEKIVI